MNAALRILKQHESITKKMVDSWSESSKEEYKESFKNASKELSEIQNAIKQLS